MIFGSKLFYFENLFLLLKRNTDVKSKENISTIDLFSFTKSNIFSLKNNLMPILLKTKFC